MSRAGLPRLKLLGAAALFSTGGVAIKAAELSSWQVAGFRSGIAALAIFLMTSEARRKFNWQSALVGVAYAATLILFVSANKLTTAANTIFLQSTAPVYILLLGPLLLKEKLRREDLWLILPVGLGLSLFFLSDDAPAKTAPNPSLG